MKHWSSRGTTLMELMVVLALLSLVMGLVGPSLAGRLDTFSLQTTANEIGAELRKAQALSRAEQVAVVVTYADREFRFLKQSRQVSQFKLPASITPVSDIGTYIFLPSGQIVAPADWSFQSARGRIVRIKTDPLAGIVVSIGGSS